MIKKIIRKFIRIIEIITETSIEVKQRPRIKIKAHEKAVNDGTSMQLYADLVSKFCIIKPQNIFEIGANFAQDAEFLRKCFEIHESNVYVFEPHPQIFNEIKKLYNFNCYELAVSNTSKTLSFNAIDIENNEYGNSGISSLKRALTSNEKNFIKVDVQSIRMDEFLDKNNIQEIDFLKIDVEGLNFEVLEGFGNELNKVKVLQIEGEYKPYWEDQKLYQDIQKLLFMSGFYLVYFTLSDDGVQSDSLWIQKKYIRSKLN